MQQIRAAVPQRQRAHRHARPGGGGQTVGHLHHHRGPFQQGPGRAVVCRGFDDAEYFLNKFAKNIASDDGVFFTPKSLVKMIVNILEPKNGILLEIKTIGLIQRYDTHRQQNMLKIA